MPTTNQIDIQKLKLDLKNFRTVPQKDEQEAVNAIISISDDRFEALIESIVEDGYIFTENIIAIKTISGEEIIVKEGNRRVAALKLIHGYLSPNSFNLSQSIITKILAISDEWKKENLKVPCIVYENDESKAVDKIVNLTHGKGDKASRDKWPSIATARHNRDMNKGSEPGLDLLEKYFKNGKNITDEQKEKWSGQYPITVLNEALPVISNRIGETNSVNIAANYPNINHREAVEKILSNIGLKNIGFKEIRNLDEDFAEKYGIPKIVLATDTASKTEDSSNANSNSTSNDGNNSQSSKTDPNDDSTTASNQTTSIQSGSNSKSNNNITNKNNSGGKAYAINDPRGVTKLLKAFSPSGLNRQKVVTLKNELLNLKLNKNPIAFGLLLRSAFEISVKAYFKDHSFSTTKNGKDKTLKEMLNEAKNHLTNNGQNQVLNKELHGAITELNKNAGILSVTSMNQLVHNETFSITESDICTLFVQIFPLLKALN